MIGDVGQKITRAINLIEYAADDLTTLDQQINDRYRVGRKLCDLGLTYAEVGDLDRALQHLRRAAEVNHQLGDRSGMD